MQIFGNGRAQGCIALAGAMVQKLRMGGDCLALDARPCLERKQGSVHTARAEIIGPALCGRFRRRGRSRTDGCVQLFNAAYREAAFRAGRYVALRHQHLVGRFHGGNAHPQVRCQAALAGQLFPRRQPAGSDLLHDMAV